ncbi:hypothetical protein Syun_028430 [Stephania yunnanensis]|uniref:F-box/LRR-repeat protein 15-like leucin rich repeat domain-containing protein n=1 Tax=Stephania yunnanensis TaxID=152371 RepID=A0AAP0ER99_9MAGN
MSKTCEGQLSPSKSATIICNVKESLLDTILKAHEKTLSIGERVDPLKVKQGERERFEKKQREEKARIDAHVKAVKEEAALKLLRQRQAARLALEEMEKSIDVYDSFAIMKDLEMMGVAKCIGHDRVLEGLGLYLKNEFPEDDDDDTLNLTNCEYVSLRGLPFLTSGAACLSYLNLTNGSGVTEALASSLLNLPNLQSIKLNGNVVDHSGLEAIGNCCILLRKLSLNKCRGVTDEGLSFLATKLKELRKLNISRRRKITEISVDNVTRSCTFLTSLKMKSCYLISKEAFTLIGERCQHLKKLDLTDTEVDDAGFVFKQD